MKIVRLSAIVGLAGVVAACSDDVVLTGERETLRSPTRVVGTEADTPAIPLGSKEAKAAEAARAAAEAEAAAAANRAEPIKLPPTRALASWTHRGGSPSHATLHAAFAAQPAVIWSAKIGQGNDRRHRISAAPVAADGRIFTLDSRATVTATSTAGATLWSRDLTPPTDRADDASGGGLALGGGRVFVTTGFGALSALDTASGELLWTQRLDAAVSGAPTVDGGLVYVMTRDNRAWAVDAENGRVKWQLEGFPPESGIVGAASPATGERLVVFPLSSGELVAALRRSGVRVWGSTISGRRKGRAYTGIVDVTGEPVVQDGVIYAGTSAGRTVAMSMSGKRIWTAQEGSVNPVQVTGGAVFLVSDENRLVRLSAETGDVVWTVELPYYTKEKVRRRKAITANFGPVLAGGRLWVAGSDGILRGFDAADGSLTAQVEIPGGAATRPIVMDGVAYLVNASGQLLALR